MAPASVRFFAGSASVALTAVLDRDHGKAGHGQLAPSAGLSQADRDQ
jgi:hypothetical protein